MFAPEEREKIRSEIIEFAKKDGRIGGGAITGSASNDNQDQWSDIDLAFGVRESEGVQETLKDYTEKMYNDFGVLHHLDVLSGSWIYRVFFLKNTLQVDLAFVPQPEFGARAPTFKLIFGTDNRVPQILPAAPDTVIGWAWLYALHARSSIKREKAWQAEYFISGMRDQVFTLSCLRYSLPDRQARGADRLPEEIKTKFEDGLVRSLRAEELQRAFRAVVDIFLVEMRAFDEKLSDRLEPALRELCEIDGGEKC